MTTHTVYAFDTMAPQVSICIPTFNRKAYLRRTLDSCLAQTFTDYEIVIVDDGSTDGTERMIREMEYPIRYEWQKNSGDAVSRNRLIELAKGKYIMFLDSDDLLIEDAVERLIRVAQGEHEDVIVYGGNLRIDENDVVIGKSRRKLYSGNVTKHLFQEIFIHPSGSMFPQDVFRTNRAFDVSLRVCSDYDLWLCLSQKYRFVALEEPTYKRRRHSGNLSMPTYQNRLTEFNVLSEFYYNKGGHEQIPAWIARRRLGQEAYRVAKAAFSQRNFQAARNYLKQSFRFYPHPKTIMFMLRTFWKDIIRPL